MLQYKPGPALDLPTPKEPYPLLNNLSGNLMTGEQRLWSVSEAITWAARLTTTTCHHNEQAVVSLTTCIRT